MEVRATSIDPRTGMGAVTLAVSDLSGMTHFYRSAIGLAVLETSPGLHTLGAGGRPLVRLLHRSNARSVPHTTGLFHLALLLPDRAWLGAWIRHFVEAGYTLDGAGDHSVSEAFYLTDPEGNRIEVYRDRPRSEWEFVDGQLRMGTERVDLKAVYTAGAGVAWSGAPPETKMGH
jgi:catechol 2,3-dioxygenase